MFDIGYTISAIKFPLQGEYLGRLLSYTNGEIFLHTTQEMDSLNLQYHHLGSFA